MKIGIRKEDKSIWERRVPFVPDDIRDLRRRGIDMVVESSPYRAFSDDAFSREGIPVQEDVNDCDIIFGIKEMPKDLFQTGKIYVFFSHVIKGQAYNMPMLARMMSRKATLFDYEKIMDDQGRRLIFFGRHAGLAGMVNTLWSLGERLAPEGVANPFGRLRQMRTYGSLAEAEAVLREIAGEIQATGVPESLHPLIIGFAGYGNVSAGAQEILDLLPVRKIPPEGLAALASDPSASRNCIYKAVFKEAHCVRPRAKGAKFDLQDYYRRGKDAYESAFDSYLPHLTVLVNCVYWDDRYPRLMTLDQCRKLWRAGRPKLRVIGDISCDIGGAVECTVKSTDPGNPVYVFEPATGQARDGFIGDGPVLMAVDILPTEIPRESSEYFSSVLKPFIPDFLNADYSLPLERLNLPPELKRALILYQGALTPEYSYLEKFL